MVGSRFFTDSRKWYYKSEWVNEWMSVIIDKCKTCKVVNNIIINSSSPPPFLAPPTSPVFPLSRHHICSLSAKCPHMPRCHKCQRPGVKHSCVNIGVAWCIYKSILMCFSSVLNYFPCREHLAFTGKREKENCELLSKTYASWTDLDSI